MITQHPKKDFDYLLECVNSGVPFTFIRFSDGEIEVLRNRKLFIGDGLVSWSKGEVKFAYPDFDKKDFSPNRDGVFRDALFGSAQHKGTGYIKGIPSSHNKARGDRDYMVQLNGDSMENLTFADLLLNANFRRFRVEFLNALIAKDNVVVLGNYRMQPKMVNQAWSHIAIPDNFIPKYDEVIDEVMQHATTLPVGSLILSSASSLTNIVGHKLSTSRRDITLIDIGTSLHDLMGMEGGIREYHSLILPATPRNLIKRVRYYLNGGHRLKW